MKILKLAGILILGMAIAPAENIRAFLGISDIGGDGNPNSTGNAAAAAASARRNISTVLVPSAAKPQQIPYVQLESSVAGAAVASELGSGYFPDEIVDAPIYCFVPTASAMLEETKLVTPWPGAIIQSAKYPYQYKILASLQNVAGVYGLLAGAAGAYAIVKEDSQNSFALQHGLSSTGVSVLAMAVSGSSYAISAADMQFTADGPAQELLNKIIEDPKNEDAYDNLFRSCGTSIITKVTDGKLAALVFKVTTNSPQIKKEFIRNNSDLEAGGYATLKSSISRSNYSAANALSVSAAAYQIGGEDTAIQSIIAQASGCQVIYDGTKSFLNPACEKLSKNFEQYLVKDFSQQDGNRIIGYPQTEGIDKVLFGYLRKQQKSELAAKIAEHYNLYRRNREKLVQKYFMLRERKQEFDSYLELFRDYDIEKENVIQVITDALSSAAPLATQALKVMEDALLGPCSHGVCRTNIMDKASQDIKVLRSRVNPIANHFVDLVDTTGNYRKGGIKFSCAEAIKFIVPNSIEYFNFNGISKKITKGANGEAVVTFRSSHMCNPSNIASTSFAGYLVLRREANKLLQADDIIPFILNATPYADLPKMSGKKPNEVNLVVSQATQIQVLNGADKEIIAPLRGARKRYSVKLSRVAGNIKQQGKQLGVSISFIDGGVLVK